MPRMANVHVVPTGGEWAVEVDGQRERRVYPTQPKAIRVARELAADHHIEVLIHWQDPRRVAERSEASL